MPFFLKRPAKRVDKTHHDEDDTSPVASARPDQILDPTCNDQVFPSFFNDEIGRALIKLENRMAFNRKNYRCTPTENSIFAIKIHAK
ncbi:hypothetical protein [Ralstonia solanacearum]|uniref:Uncharacterized protein n=1 Tax=Ralstonia solanacearum TaxID=305 RepID=A0AAE3T4X8_RALSL|nr:hypothetical protein [Ralstonia solanacearum]MBB6582629.1 hypothetical protein [Ralstonia solanacearum]MDB0522268.1 hypothetical protein [Ralstonia solanacearum]